MTVVSETWVLETPDRQDWLADTPVPRRFPVQAWTPSAGRGPVVVFLHGTQGRRHAYLTWIHELASHGYTVVAADHPPVALLPNFPDGTSAPPSSAWSDLLRRATDPPSFVIDPVFLKAHALVADDVRAILDDLPSRLGVSTDRVLLAGHSFGGGLATTLCDEEPRCAAIINLDGPPFADPALAPVQAPLLVVLAGRTRTARALDVVWEPIDGMIREAAGPTLVVTMPRTGHLELSDLGLLIRPALLRLVFPGSQFGPGPLEPKLRAVAAVSVAFADRHLRGDAAVAPEAVVAQHVDLELVHR